MSRLIPWAILVWTLVSWGGRIGLLTEPETADPASWARIAGSLAVGTVASVLLLTGRRRRLASWVFAAWTGAIWGRSLLVVWTEANTAGFRLVHTALAVVWFALAVLAVRVYGFRRPPAVEAGSGPRSAEEAGPGGRISTRRSTTSSTER